jgi:HEPN domain-containing protein
VQAAADQRALWTTADDALKRARAAFLDGDYPDAIRAAQTAAEEARLGIAQTHYPMFQLPKL